MEFREEKRKLIATIINSRIPEERFIEFAETQGAAVPRRMLERWKTRFYAINAIEFKKEFKTINKFCLGADPEFVFQSPDHSGDTGYAFSQQIGLNTLEAFGSDMTGRQAELRAWPNRSALYVVASLVDTLRWMSVRYPKVFLYKWIANAYFGGDGVGGHIHFGRKRGDRDASVKSLDALTTLLTYTGAVDGAGQLQRIVATRYGRPGDIRVQPHGYEFRTMPTWMASPWAAFLTLTLAKLCIFHSLKLPTIKVLQNSLSGNITQIKSMLHAFANVDDDARIALIGIQRIGVPAYSQFTDFKKAWGIEKGDPFKEVEKCYFPPIIEPTDETVKELFDVFVNNKPLGYRKLLPTWKTFKLPEGASKIVIEGHRAGIPEIASGLLSRGVIVHIMAGREGSRNILLAPPSELELDVKAIREALVKRKGLIKNVTVNPPQSGHLYIFVPSSIANNWVVNKDVVADIRWLLSKTGLFPIAKADMIGEVDIKYFAKKKTPL